MVTRRAAEQLDAAYEFLATENLSAARKQQDAIVRAIGQPANFPEIGRPGRIFATRELVIQGTPYVAVYRLHKSIVSVIAMLHGARRWPERF